MKLFFKNVKKENTGFGILHSLDE